MKLQIYNCNHRFISMYKFDFMPTVTIDVAFPHPIDCWIWYKIIRWFVISYGLLEYIFIFHNAHTAPKAQCVNQAKGPTIQIHQLVLHLTCLIGSDGFGLPNSHVCEFLCLYSPRVLDRIVEYALDRTPPILQIAFANISNVQYYYQQSLCNLPHLNNWGMHHAPHFWCCCMHWCNYDGDASPVRTSTHSLIHWLIRRLCIVILWHKQLRLLSLLLIPGITWIKNGAIN